MSGLRRITPSSWLRLTDGVLESRIIRAAWALVSMLCCCCCSAVGLGEAQAAAAAAKGGDLDCGDLSLDDVLRH